MRIDAHCHTDCSDGSLTIEQRIAFIKACHLDAATITDHDFISVEQVDRAEKACAGMPYVPGIELSLRHQGQVVHLLGYYIQPAHAGLQEHLCLVQGVDRDCTLKLLRYFQARGARFDLEDLVSTSLHTFYSLMLVKRVAGELFENNPQRCVPAFQAAMEATGLSYPDLAPWDVRNAIELLHRAGGIAVLAHPGGENDATMRSLGFLIHDRNHLKHYVDWGLDGIEVRSPVHSAQEKQFYAGLAEDFHLLATAGSDCHGDDPYLGPALMDKFDEIPPHSYEALAEYFQAKQTQKGIS